MDIITDDYEVLYDSPTQTIFFKGFLRLNGLKEYQPIMDLILEVIQPKSTLTINFSELEFLNSSGISMLSMLVVKVRQMANVHLILKGSSKILWQTKSLRNLQRLMPSIQLEFSP